MDLPKPQLDTGRKEKQGSDMTLDLKLAASPTSHRTAEIFSLSFLELNHNQGVLVHSPCFPFNIPEVFNHPQSVTLNHVLVLKGSQQQYRAPQLQNALVFRHLNSMLPSVYSLKATSQRVICLDRLQVLETDRTNVPCTSSLAGVCCSHRAEFLTILLLMPTKHQF